MPFAAPNSSRCISVVVASSFFLLSCGSFGTRPTKDAVRNSKVDASTVHVCDTEKYQNNPDYVKSSKKTDVHKLKNEETVYLHDETEKCETVFDEDSGPECGVQRSIRLIWKSGSQVIDSFSFLESGCEEPGSHSLSAEPWAPDSIQLKGDLVKVRHYWNYYVRTEAEEKYQCLLRILKIDRKKMKLVDVGWNKCQ